MKLLDSYNQKKCQQNPNQQELKELMISDTYYDSQINIVQDAQYNQSKYKSKLQQTSQNEDLQNKKGQNEKSFFESFCDIFTFKDFSEIFECCVDASCCIDFNRCDLLSQCKECDCFSGCSNCDGCDIDCNIDCI